VSIYDKIINKYNKYIKDQKGMIFLKISLNSLIIDVY